MLEGNAETFLASY